jgi:hypothetical protein
VNYGPLSLRMGSGIPWMIINLANEDTTSSAFNRLATTMARHALLNSSKTVSRGKPYPK